MADIMTILGALGGAGGDFNKRQEEEAKKAKLKELVAGIQDPQKRKLAELYPDQYAKSQFPSQSPFSLNLGGGAGDVMGQINNAIKGGQGGKPGTKPPGQAGGTVETKPGSFAIGPDGKRYIVSATGELIPVGGQ